jgi:ABC-type spermidine/putrescine transport system permease subunit II
MHWCAANFRAKKFLLSFMLLPVIVPHVITAIAMYSSRRGSALSQYPYGSGFCHAVVTLPVVLADSAFTRCSRWTSTWSGRLGLGGSRFYVFQAGRDSARLPRHHVGSAFRLPRIV